MPKLRSKRTWKATEIIDLPYAPFQNEDQTERMVLDHIANGILRVYKSGLRTQPSFKEERLYSFDIAESIVGIDVSNIGDEGASYLDSIFLVTRFYPFILINCSIKTEVLYGLPLHKQLRDYGYILPIFRRIGPSDLIYADRRYGTNLIQLLSGLKKSIFVSELKGLNDIYTLNDLRSRFSGIKVQGDQIFYDPEIIWLGVDSEELRNGLTYLFVNNINSFDLSKFCSDFNVGESELNKFLFTSMLFGKAKGKVMFRLLSSHITTGIMKSLVDQFDREMLNRKVIDTTHTNYPKFEGKFLEYHSIGKLFDQRDTFAFKLLSYIKQCFDSKTFDKIIIIDNGKEAALYELLPNIFTAEFPIVRILNFLGNPVLFPFDELTNKERVVIIADIVNTGNFLGNVLKMLRKKYDITVIGIFAFVIDTLVKTAEYFTEDDPGEFHYFVEKSLTDIKDIRSFEQRERFIARGEEAYLRYWHMINVLGKVDMNFTKNGIRFLENYGTPIDVSSYQCHSINLNANAALSLNDEMHFKKHIQSFLTINNITLLIRRDSDTEREFGEIVRQIKTVEVISVNNQNRGTNLKETIQRHASILVFAPAINLGQRTAELVKSVRRHVKPNTKVFVFAIFSRKNTIRETMYLSSKYEKAFEDNDATFHSYYESNLPFYLVIPENGENRHIDSLLNEIHHAS